MKRIVVIGGGTGTFMVLSALKNTPDVHLAAVVSMADDGASTGLLRDQYGVLPPGDIRRALVALSQSSETLRELFNYRFEGGGLHGHNFGNLFLSALEKVTGNFATAVQEASSVLSIEGEVVPVTLDDVRLVARLSDGKIIRGETNIDIPRTAERARIDEVWLEPEARMNPSVRRVLQAADLIVIGPGDLYTSLVPNLLVQGVSEAIRASKAKKVYVANLMTKYGETHGFGPMDFFREIERYLGRGVLDYAVWNSRRPPEAVLRRYRRERAEFIDPRHLPTRHGRTKFIKADLLDAGKFVRHNPRKKLGKVLMSLVNR
ncbi:MAG TPA: gluconeogenesis factor YvcK family protein [Candidatus Paceibacterota bacterium]|nr:gluconeogenesis factor YvcK family protein [Candidatus Paceibacterota bacterium]